MERLFVLLLVSILFTLSSWALAAEHVTVTLAEPTDPAQQNRLKVVLTIVNDGDTPVVVMKYNTPNWDTGRIAGDLFTLVGTTDGRNYPFSGGYETPGALGDDVFYTLSPGDSRSALVNLDNYYNEWTSPMNVTFNLRLGQYPDSAYPTDGTSLPDGDPRNAHDVTSNTLEVFPIAGLPQPDSIDDAPKKIIKSDIQGMNFGGVTPDYVDPYIYYSAHQMPSSAPSQICSAPQLQKANHYMIQAGTLAGTANAARLSAYNSGTTTFDPTTPAGSTYNFYFGYHVLGLQEPDITENWGGTDGQVEALIMNHAQGWDMNVTCEACPSAKSAYPDTTMAVAYVGANYTKLCTAFFNLPGLGYNSMASVLYHEMTHYPNSFYDGHTWVSSLATADYSYVNLHGLTFPAYDPTRWKVTHNAASFESFALSMCESTSEACWLLDTFPDNLPGAPVGGLVRRLSHIHGAYS